MSDRSRNLHDSVTPTREMASVIGPRPTPPRQKLTARPVAHDLDWDHIPTAPKTATLTREQVQREIEAAKQHEPYLIGYGGTQANAAFGGAA